MSGKLYVGNLPYTFTSDDLRDLFKPYGEVQSALVIMDRKTGRSRGFGFVEFGTDEEANSAAQTLNGSSVGGRNVVVNAARER